MNDSEKTREQLIEEIKLFRTLIDTLPDRIFVKDAQGRFIICNKAVEDVAEIHQPDGAIGKSDFDLYPPEKAKEYYAREQEIIKTGIPMVNEEVCGVHPVTGGQSWSLSTKFPWHNKDGKIIGIIGSNREITERKNIQDALRESENRYKTIFETVREGILIIDLEKRQFMYANPAACELFGYSTDEFVKLKIEDIHRPQDMGLIKKTFGSISRKEQVTAREIPCLKKDKTVFYADITSEHSKIDKIDCAIGCFIDVTRHKLDEEALRQSEQQIKSVVENIGLGVTLLSPQMEVISINNHLKQQIPEIDLSTRPICYKIFNNPPRSTICPNCPVCLTLADGLIHESINIVPVGYYSVNLRIISSPIKDAQGRITAVIELVENITERAKTEADLRESEEKFRGLAERSFDMIFTTDARGVVTYVSPASQRIFGYKSEEMTGRSFTSFLKKSEIPKAVQRFTDKLQGKQLGSLNLEAVKKDGSRVFIELISSLVIKDNAVVGVQGIIRDVTERIKAQEELQKAHSELEFRVQQRTADLAGAVRELQQEIAERKRAEESLIKAEERFRTIFENAVVGIYRTTPDGQILMANPAIIKLLGYSSFEEISRLNLENEGIDPATPRSEFKKTMQEYGAVTGMESIWFRRDGSRLYVLENAFAVRDDNNDILYYEGTVQDITKRKEAEKKLMHYQEQLRSLASQLSLAEERLRRKIATELHDNVSQNLAFSKMKLEALAQSIDNADQVKSLKEITGLIGRTIEVSRTLTFEMSPPVLYELGFIPALGWLANQTRQRFNIETELFDDGKPKRLTSDVSVLLFQAVRELVNNVIKHAKAHKLTIKASQIRDNIYVAVEDDGVGFNMERAITARKNHSKGAVDDYSMRGFGLFNIRERLNQIGGTVEIHSKSGKGTSVTLIAPLAKTHKIRAKTKKKK